MPHDKANMADLAAALSGVELGLYDRRIVEWLAGWEPSTVAVVCGLISRARGASLDAAQLAAVLDALDDAAEWRCDRGGQPCEACEAAPDGLCDDHDTDIERGRRYAAAARQLRQEAGR